MADTEEGNETERSACSRFKFKCQGGAMQAPVWPLKSASRGLGSPVRNPFVWPGHHYECLQHIMSTAPTA